MNNFKKQTNYSEKIKKALSALFLSFIMLFIVPQNTSAIVFLQTEDEGINNSDNLILDADDSSATTIKLQFGDTLDAFFEYDIIADEFDINKSINFNQNEAKELVIHTGTVFPGAPLEGQKFFRTDLFTEFTFANGDWREAASGTGATNNTGTFLRDNESDNYTGTGTLTFDPGTTLDVDDATVNLDAITNDVLVLDSNDSAATTINLQFGETLARTLSYDIIDDEFDINIDLNLNNNELHQFRIENLGVTPTCNASLLGKKYFDTVLDASFVCTSGGFVRETNGAGGETTFFLDIAGGSRTSMGIGSVAGGNSSVLRAAGTQSRSRWSFPVPENWSNGTDIIVEMYWSPSDASAGNVRWEFDHAAHAIGEVVDAVNFTEIILDQASPGTTLELESTGTNFTIPGAGISADDMLNIQINRPGNAAADTYGPEVNIHMMKVIYTSN